MSHPRKPVYLCNSDEESLSLWAFRLRIQNRPSGNYKMAYDVYPFTDEQEMHAEIARIAPEAPWGCAVRVAGAEITVQKLVGASGGQIQPLWRAGVHDVLEAVRIACSQKRGPKSLQGAAKVSHEAKTLTQV